MPITAARRRYSAIVDRLTPIETAICPLARAKACFSLRTSRTFRIGALSAGIGPPLAWPQRGPRAAIRSPTARALRPPSTGWPASIGMGGRLPSESVAGLRRNQWPAWLGLRNLNPERPFVRRLNPCPNPLGEALRTFSGAPMSGYENTPKRVYGRRRGKGNPEIAVALNRSAVGSVWRRSVASIENV